MFVFALVRVYDEAAFPERALDSGVVGVERDVEVLVRVEFEGAKHALDFQRSVRVPDVREEALQ